MSAAVASDSCQDGKIGGDMVLISGEVSFDSLNHYGSCDKDGPLHVAFRGGRNERGGFGPFDNVRPAGRKNISKYLM